MPKMATKAADNVFYKARIAAASWNEAAERVRQR